MFDGKLFVKITTVANLLGVHPDTLRRWDRTGQYKALRTPGGTRLYSILPSYRSRNSNQDATTSQPDVNQTSSQININKTKTNEINKSEINEYADKNLTNSYFTNYEVNPQ